MATDMEKMREGYFTALAPNYEHLTGNTTRDLFAQVLDQFKFGINSYSVIHDNASGPGTATEVVLAWSAARAVLPKIHATDSTPAMIDRLNTKVSEHKGDPGWRNVEPRIIHSSDLSAFEEKTFTHTFCNFSIFTFGDPLKCLLEIHRTLRPAGVAVITTWKRFAVTNLLASAQDHVKGAGWAAEHPLPVAGPEFRKDGHTAKLVYDAGWESGKIKTVELSILVKEGEDWDGLYEFLTSTSKAITTKDWTEQELQKWPEAVEAAMQKEKSEHGGILFEAWAVLARKWDQMCG